MKLAFVFGSMRRGGAERVIASLANTFCAQGDDVHIITLDSSRSGYALDGRVQHIALGLAGDSANLLQALRRNMKVASTLRRHIRAGGYEAVVTFQLRTAVLLQYAFPFGRPFWLITSERANPRARRLSRFMKLQYDLLLPRVDGFIFQTERVSRCYPGILRRKGRVIPNGVFPEILPDRIVPFDARRHLDVCAVGRLTPQKGYDVLLQAFSAFHRTHPGHRLHIYGTGMLREQLEARIAALQLTDCVTLHGNVPDVMHQVADMGMFVLSSRFEGMPNALMEAMACGIPCIAADCDFGPAELIHDGENGLLVPVEDADALAAAMTRLADDPALAERCSRQALCIRADYAGSTFAAQVRQYITDVISRR